MEKILTIKQAAALTGLHPITLYNKGTANEFPTYKKGGRVFVFESDLLNWIKSGKREKITVNQ
ncbi:MAG: hypothetical protein BGN92_12925 [Sphingobacteriales bacterium 41-5]|nr:MAG: hypothetical protein BGN92_12925 [Sphingobacteriales bacterium 41-5]